MNDRPSATELLAAVERFLEETAVPGLEGPAKYHARVAANVVRIVARELATEDEHLAREWDGLAALLGSAPEPKEPRRRIARGAALSTPHPRSVHSLSTASFHVNFRLIHRLSTVRPTGPAGSVRRPWPSTIPRRWGLWRPET